MKEIEKLLVDLGLSDNEASVYLAALKLGSTTVANMSLESNVRRSTVYGCVDSLLQKGLLHTEVVNKRKLFIAEDPNKLFDILDRKKKELSKLLPLLSQDYLKSAGHANRITQHQGIDSIKSIYDNLLNELNEGDEYLVISDQQKWHQLDEDYFEAFMRERAMRHLNIKLLLQTSVHATEYCAKQTQYNMEIKLLPADMVLDINMVILPHKIIYMQIVEPLQATVIENIHIIKMTQQLFHLLWRMIPEK